MVLTFQKKSNGCGLVGLQISVFDVDFNFMVVQEGNITLKPIKFHLLILQVNETLPIIILFCLVGW